MKHTLLALLLAASSASAASWESFPLREDGSIAVWTVAGPLPNTRVMVHGRSCVGFEKDYLANTGGERGAVPEEDDAVPGVPEQPVAWKTTFADSAGLLDYIEILGVSKQTPGVAYAFCRLISDKAQPALLNVRSNDGVRVWLNTDRVHDNHLGRTISAAEDHVPVTLKKGNNRLLAKVDQNAGNWGLLLRVTAPDGRVIQGVRSAVATDSLPGGKFIDTRFRAVEAVLNTDRGQRQVVIADVTAGNLRDLTCEIRKDEWPAPQVFRLGTLAPGRHRLELDVPVITKTGPAHITLRCATDELKLPEVVLRRTRPWVVYLVQHVHTDIGYTRPHAEILPEHLRFIDYALDFCDLTDAYPDDARFRWTCEITWAVREYLKRRPQSEIDRLKRRVAEGRIELTGMFVNMSEIATESGLAASLQPIRDLKNDFGPAVRTAMQNDVNGIAWCLVDFFQDTGVKYVLMGINDNRGLPIFDQPTPFWWESPSGNRVLALRADHYHTGNNWRIHDADLVAVEDGLSEYLESLSNRNYPFDRVSVQYSGYHTDNSPPAMKMCDLIRAWNEKYAWPRLRSATANEFLAYVEKNHADELPVHRKAWPDWWTDGFGSAAAETAAARKTDVDVAVSETLLAMARLFGARLAPGVTDRAAAIHENLLFYDEHTFGAAESISDPMAENTRVQWSGKAAYVWDAVKQAAMLREEALGALQPFLPRVSVPTVAIFNTLNWKRSGLVEVFIDNEILPRGKGYRIVDAQTGKTVLAQPLRSRSEGTYWALWVEDVPPLGYKSCRIEAAGPAPAGPKPTGAETGVLENAFYRLTVDPKTGGLTSIVDKQTGRELVDKQAERTCAQLFHEASTSERDLLPDAFQRTNLRNVKVRWGSAGPVWKSLVFEADMAGCAEPAGVHGEIRLYETEKRVEFHFAIRKLPDTRPEAVYVAFPFAWADAEVIYETHGGVLRPGADQLPGTASDWQTVQNFLAVRGRDGQIIWGSDQAPLVQLGGIKVGRWQPIARVERPHVYSWVMNNYWNTNFRATQEGEFRWSYDLTSTSDTSNTAAARFGWGSRVPLVARVLPPGKATTIASAASCLDLDAPNLVLVNARPATHGDGIILHLREVEGKPIAFRLVGASGAGENVAEVNVLEERLRSVPSELSFVPYETKFVELGQRR